MRADAELNCDGMLIQKIVLNHTNNILSVDLENWPGIPCREDALYLLELFKKKNAKATFFVLGSVAEKEPDLIKQIDVEGHEIASHGWTHRPLSKMTPEEFRDEMKKSIALLGQIVDKPVFGFRAPIFSIMEETYWALDILMEVGIKYDSSIFPIAGPRYGMPEFPREAVRIHRGGNSIIEVPLSTVRGLGRNWPVSGGGYFRFLPYPVIKRAVRAVRADGFPFVVYCHPYEFHQEWLPYPNAILSVSSLEKRWIQLKTNVSRHTMRNKLLRLLDDFRFCSFREILPDL